MNELKSNNTLANIDSIQNGDASNVSTFVRKEEKTYVRKYSMKKDNAFKWVKDHRKEDNIGIIYPNVGKHKIREAAADPRRRGQAKTIIFSLAISFVLVLLGFAINFAEDLIVIEEVRIEGDTRYTEFDLLSAAGLNMGDRLPLITSDGAEDAVLYNLPYIKSCDISIEFPNILIFKPIDEVPEVYAEIEGLYYIMTSSMRVLEFVESEEALTGLLRIELPRVTKAIVGEELILEGTSCEYIREFFKLIDESELNGRLGIVYFDKKFDLVVSVDDKFRILLGAPSDMGLKIASVVKIIQDNEDKCASSGIIDVRFIDVCGIILDAGIDPNTRE